MMMTIMVGLGIICIALGAGRIALSGTDKQVKPGKIKNSLEKSAVCQTVGNQEIQSDVAGIDSSSAGILAVLADGIGKANTGRVCAQVAADTLLDAYQPYRVLHNPEYFFKTSFYEANRRIQKMIGERRGGTCLAAVFVNGETFHYSLAGDVRVALLRNQELIPISQGHTLDILALNAFKKGSLSRTEAVWSLEEKQVWNYLGMDGFREIEVCEKPIRLKTGDVILMATKGIYQVLSWADMEDILLKDMTLKEKADCLVMEADSKKNLDKENGSVLLLKAEVLYEKN